MTYETEDMVDECQRNRPHKIDGATVETKRATPREDSNKDYSTNKRLFVGGLKDDMSDDDLTEYFSKYGAVVKVDQMTDKVSRGIIQGLSDEFVITAFSQKL